MELGNISKPTYGPGPEALGSSTPGLVTMAHVFLRLVQPNPLPIGGCTAAGGSQGCGGLLEVAGSPLNMSLPAVVTVHPAFKHWGEGKEGYGWGNQEWDPKDWQLCPARVP